MTDQSVQKAIAFFLFLSNAYLFIYEWKKDGYSLFCRLCLFLSYLRRFCLFLSYLHLTPFVCSFLSLNKSVYTTLRTDFGR